MKKFISSIIAVAMLIPSLTILSSCDSNTASDSNIGNSSNTKEFSNNVAGIWMLLEDESPYYSVSFLTISEDMNMTGGVYPGSYDRTCEISEIKAKNDGSFQAVLYYPATEATAMDDAMPEYRETVIFSTNDTFRNSLVIESETGKKNEYKYISADFDKATKEFDLLINNKPSHSSDENQNQQQSTQKTAVRTYTHAALEGAVIIQSDTSTGALKYKKKCEKCGKVDNTTVNTYIKTSTLNTSFYCDNCKSNQKVRIQGTMDVDWE